MNDFQGHRTIGSVCKGRSNNFDFIRFVAASLVIYSHAFPLSAGNEGELLKDLTQSQWSFGSLSVAVFFIISGFLIAQSYDQGRNPIKYIKARVLRIFPGLACVLVLSAFVLGPIVTQLPMKEYFCNLQTYQYLKSVFLYPLYWNLPGVFENNFYSPSVNGSLWTIPFEFFFYGVVLLLGILKLLQKKNINFALFLSFLLLEIYKHQLFPIEGHFMSLPRYSLIELGLYFSAGMLLYSLRDYVVLNQHLAMISLVALSVLVLNGYYTIPFAIFGSYLIMYASFSEKVRLYQFSKYGDFSYGIYIYGFPVQQAVVFFNGGSMNPYVNMAFSYPITLILAVGSWYFIEKPCMRLKKVQLIKGDVPGKNLLEKIDSIYTKAVESVSRFGWKTFIAAIVVALVLINTFYAAPSVIEFPYQNDSIFLSGWLPQTQSETYRWVQKESCVRMDRGQKTTAFFVEGFVPETFTEVTEVSIYFDDALICQVPLSAGGAVSIMQDVSGIPMPKDDVLIKIVFNAEHVPEQGAPDQRTMSALINRIGFS